MTIHLTLTGWGSLRERILCGAEPQADDKHYHVMYCNDRILESPDICQACLAVWQEED
jgi:hypothetical protein